MFKSFWGSQEQQSQQPTQEIPAQSGYPPSMVGSSASSRASTPGSSSFNAHHRTSDSAHSSPRAQLPPAEAAGVIAVLKDKSVDELRRLLTEKGAYDTFFHSLDQVKIQNNLRDELRKEAVQIAKMEKEHTETGSTTEESYPIRRLQLSDKDKGYVDLLKQLTLCDSISDADFAARLEDISSYGDDHIICVIEEDHSQKIIATGSLFSKKKLIRNCGKVGHIEDIVVDTSVRGKHLGQKIIRFLSEHAKSIGCYKIILNCDKKNMGFYEKCGFKEKGVEMALYFD